MLCWNLAIFVRHHVSRIKQLADPITTLPAQNQETCERRSSGFSYDWTVRYGGAETGSMLGPKSLSTSASDVLQSNHSMATGKRSWCSLVTLVRVSKFLPEMTPTRPVFLRLFLDLVISFRMLNPPYRDPYDASDGVMNR